MPTPKKAEQRHIQLLKAVSLASRDAINEWDFDKANDAIKILADSEARAVAASTAELMAELARCNDGLETIVEIATEQIKNIGLELNAVDLVKRLARLARQEKEHHEFYRSKVSDYMGAEIKRMALTDSLRIQLTTAQTALREARKDGERLDWLFNNDASIASDEGFGDGASVWTCFWATGNRNDRCSHSCSGDTPSAAIDNAMQPKEPPGSVSV